MEGGLEASEFSDGGVKLTQHQSELVFLATQLAWGRGWVVWGEWVCGLREGVGGLREGVGGLREGVGSLRE